MQQYNKYLIIKHENQTHANILLYLLLKNIRETTNTLPPISPFCLFFQKLSRNCFLSYICTFITCVSFLLLQQIPGINKLEGRKCLFWLLVLEVSINSRLTPLSLACGGISWQGACSRARCSLVAAGKQKKRKGAGCHNPMWGHTSSDLITSQQAPHS